MGRPDLQLSDGAGGPTHGSRRVLLVGRVMIGLVSALMLVLLGRVIQLQAFAPAQIQQLVDSQNRSMKLRARRGSLVDRHNRPLAVTRVIQRLFVDPQIIEQRGTFAEKVGYTLGYDPAVIEQTLSRRPNSRFVIIDQQLNDQRLDKLKVFRLRGLATESRRVREYPQDKLAGALIGFVGFEGKGLEGLELHFDQELAGEDGAIRYLRDARGRPMWVEADQYHPSRDGKTIRLTLDLTIQSIAETELAAACETFGAESGELIVMQPQTGEILAMANYPPYSPADVKTAKPQQRRNRCVTDVYEPGSTFKPFVYAAAVDMGRIEPTAVIDSNVSPPGRRLHDTHDHGRISFEQGVILSSNRAMAQVGLRMGARRLNEAVRRFGFGSTTRSNLPGEVVGIVHPVEKWTSFSVTSVPMGQEIAVTALQLARAFCTFANGGVLVRPIIRESDTHDVVNRVIPRILSPQTADHVRDVLRRVVSEGTGRRANSKQYAIFGKTGTAQIAENGRYAEDQYVGSFVAGAPFDRPQIVVVCSIHRPDTLKGHYGGVIAAPAVRAVIEQSLLYMGVSPQSAAATSVARQ